MSADRLRGTTLGKVRAAPPAAAIRTMSAQPDTAWMSDLVDTIAVKLGRQPPKVEE